MMAIMRQIEEMEQKEKAVKAGPCSTQLEPGAASGMATRKWARNVGFRVGVACDAAGGEAAGQAPGTGATR